LSVSTERLEALLAEKGEAGHRRVVARLAYPVIGVPAIHSTCRTKHLQVEKPNVYSDITRAEHSRAQKDRVEGPERLHRFPPVVLSSRSSGGRRTSSIRTSPLVSSGGVDGSVLKMEWYIPVGLDRIPAWIGDHHIRSCSFL
jgi:hypothetical protein